VTVTFKQKDGRVHQPGQQPPIDFIKSDTMPEILDAAMHTKGGIDFNSANLNLQIKRDGKGVPLPWAQQDMEQLMNIEGFVPVILEIKPAIDLPIFVELKSVAQTVSA
jgi:hypothetical protein